MSNLGNISLNLYTIDRDSTTYARAGNTVSHIDRVVFNRQLPAQPGKPLRTSTRFERGFPVVVNSTTNESVERTMAVTIACTAPAGISVADAKAYIAEALTQAATNVADLAFSGDIHLG